MGASVGVGGLIIGISMLVVFSMAYQSISTQIESGVDRIEEAEEPLPTFTIDDAVIYTGAIVDVTIVSGGSGYSSGGTIEASSGSGGFSATYTVNSSGAITAVEVTSHGNYTSLPSLVVNGGGTPTSVASLTAVRGNVLYANMTNTGSTTVDHDDMWLFLDGQDPTPFSTVYQSSISSNLWFSGETLFLNWYDTGLNGNERMTLSVGSTTVGHGLW
tara:strand:- start:956 stop:1603 length:648 start_codon:yes stop_codon:yes gene_type:complete